MFTILRDRLEGTTINRNWTAVRDVYNTEG
jgi:hypothetical protein